MKRHIGGTDRNADYVMLFDHFEALRLDVVNHMIAYCLEHNVCVDKNNAGPANCGEIEKKGKVGTITLEKEELISGEMERMKIP